MIQSAANIASKSGHPVVAGIGKGVQVADKVTGGRLSHLAGKGISTLNSLNPSGRLRQKALNKVMETGMGDRISKAVSKKNENASSVMNNQKKLQTSKKADVIGDSRKNETVDDSAQSGTGSVRFSMKMIKYSIIFVCIVSVIAVFCNLFITASQMVLSVVTLGTADLFSDKELGEKITNKKTEDFEEEKKDEDTDEVSYDIYINNVKDNRFNNIIQISNKTTYLKRKYNEADFDKIDDYFPQIDDESKNYDKNMVYDFFFKMYKLYSIYEENYNVKLDLTLLMSTLNLQSSDKNVIFESNLSDEDRKATIRENFDNFDFYYDDWGFYKLSTDDSEFDMQILAQKMVSITSETGCENETKDGKCYKIDEEKYREFLKEFLEKKYYFSGQYSINNNEEDAQSASLSMAQKMVKLANNEYKLYGDEIGGMKYISEFGYTYKVPWSAIFTWYISSKTEHNGKYLYPDIIPFKSASTGTNIKNFNSSELPNINFYYNDSCKNLTGKNISGTYTPKIGDYVFIDWESQYYDISSNTQDHTGIVEKYEDGIIYTIEGHISNKLAKRAYSITDCRIIGFGSWY